MVKRIIFSIVLLILMFFLPFWAFAIFTVLGMFLFDNFWEGVVFVLFSELLFGAKGTDTTSIILQGVVAPVLVLIVIEFMKKKLKFYNK